MQKKMKTKEQVKQEYPDCDIRNIRCPECGGILVTKYGAISITICVEDDCLYADYDYDWDYDFER